MTCQTTRIKIDIKLMFENRSFDTKKGGIKGVHFEFRYERLGFKKGHG